MPEKLNVCLMNDSFPPVIDGVANAVVNYANVISSQLGNATVVTPAYPNVVDNYPFEVVRYKSINIGKLCSYRAGYPFSSSKLQQLSDNGFDIIHTHCPWASAVMARVLREKTSAPIVLTYHTKFDVEIACALHNKTLQAQAEKFVLGNIAACDKVWTVSRGARDNLLEMAMRNDVELCGSQIDVIENGVDFPCGRAEDAFVAELRNSYKIQQDEPLFLFVGRLFWYKGIRLILDALKTISTEGYSFRMLFVGDGGDRAEMEAYVEELGLSEQCIFVGAIHDREELRVYYTAADLFLFPSEYDTNGIVVREAAACGVGSLLIDGSCASEGITHGHNGILTKADPQAIAEELRFACKNHSKMREIGDNAMSEIYISWDTAVKHAYSLYGGIIEDAKANRTTRRESFIQEEFFSLMNTATDSIQKIRSIPYDVRDEFIEGRDKFKRTWQKLKDNIDHFIK